MYDPARDYTISSSAIANDVLVDGASTTLITAVAGLLDGARSPDCTCSLALLEDDVHSQCWRVPRVLHS
jgi:hypothetical protein